MTDAKPLSAEEIRALHEKWEQNGKRGGPLGRWLATIRRRDELIRHIIEHSAVLDPVSPDKCPMCKEIEAIVEAGNG